MGGREKVQFIDGEPRQIGSCEPGILFHDLTDHAGFAHGDPVGFCQGFQFCVFFQGLAQNRSLHGTGLQDAADFICQLFLKGGTLFGICIFNGYQNGVGILGDIAMLQHGSNYCIDRYVQVGSLQIHIVQNNACIFVSGTGFHNLLIAVDLQLDAWVHIQAYNGIHCAR